MSRAVLVALLLVACSHSEATPSAPSRVESLRLKVVRSFPHDRSAFTQGLLWFDGRLYESTGVAGRSTVRRGGGGAGGGGGGRAPPPPPVGGGGGPGGGGGLPP